MDTDAWMRRHSVPGSPTPSAEHTPAFQSVPFGTSGHASIPSAAGRTACHTSTYGVPVTSTCGWATAREAILLAPEHQVVEQHADARTRPRLQRGEHVGKVIGAVEALDDDTLDAEVVAPDELDQLGVVHAFHEDPARPGDPGASADQGAAARGGASGGRGACPCEVCGSRVRVNRVGRDETHRGAVDRERTGVVREPPLPSRGAAQHDLVALERDQLAEEPRAAVQHPGAGSRRVDRVRGREAGGGLHGAGEDPPRRSGGSDTSGEGGS